MNLVFGMLGFFQSYADFTMSTTLHDLFKRENIIPIACAFHIQHVWDEHHTEYVCRWYTFWTILLFFRGIFSQKPDFRVAWVVSLLVMHSTCTKSMSRVFFAIVCASITLERPLCRFFTKMWIFLSMRG